MIALAPFRREAGTRQDFIFLSLLHEMSSLHVLKLPLMC